MFVFFGLNHKKFSLENHFTIDHSKGSKRDYLGIYKTQLTKPSRI